MIVVKKYIAYIRHDKYVVTKVTLFGFIPLFIRKVEV
jgi:hypothetical protein